MDFHQIDDRHLRSSIVLVAELHHLTACKAGQTDYYLEAWSYTAQKHC